MKRISWLLIVVFFLSVVMSGINLAGNLVVDADTLRVAKITAVQGDVQILRAGGEKYFPAFIGMGLTQGDSIITGKDGRVTLELAEDKELKIGENSRVMISELVQSQENNTDKTSLNLKAGQVYTHVKGMINPGGKYEIRTPTAVMGVRGTQFFVSLASGGQAKVVTLDGNVIVTVPQLVTLEDGTTITQDVEIVVQPNQIFVQTGDMTDPGRYDLETLTGDEELSLFVLETLREISAQQPDLINPEILQNLEERIEQAREEQQERQRQQERQQEELEPSIQYDSNDTGNESSSSSDSGTGNGSQPGTDPGDDDNEDLPEIVITTQLDNIYLQVGGEEPWMRSIETDPAADVELEVEVEDESIAGASFDGNTLYIYGLEAGSTTVTVIASKEGYLPAEISFNVTVYEDFEEGNWDKSIIDGYEGTIRHTDIALDSKGMPHIIYEAGSVRYRHWNGSSWQEEEPQIGSREGSLTIAEINGNDYYLISYHDNSGRLGHDRFNGVNWSHQAFGDEGVKVTASSIDTTLYNGKYGTGVSYYDEENGDLYFRFDEDSTDILLETWGEPFLVDGENSDAGKSSSLAFGEDGRAYIAYYDYSDEEESGSLKLAVISDPLNPELQEIINIDNYLGYEENGQYVSLAVDDESSEIIFHLAYYNAVNKRIKYAKVRCVQGDVREWITEKETLDGGESDEGKYASLALDYEGNPHISYYAEDDSGGALKYARRDPNNEEEWLIEVIDQGEGVGLYSSIAFDNNLLIPHFAYLAMTYDENWVVKHATRQDIMNTIEPGELYGTEQDFEDATFCIESFGNDFWYAREEEGGYLTASDYLISEDDDGLVFILKSDYLNNLEFTGYEGPYRIWIYFDYGLPVSLTIEVAPNLEANIERSKPDAAYDPEKNRYLMVYQKNMVEDYPEIWGRFISADGEQGPEFAISEDNCCYEPKVVYNSKNNNFLVTWSDDRFFEESLIYAQFLDDEGNPSGESGNFPACPVIEETNQYGQDRPAVAVNTFTGDYLIVWEEYVFDGNLQGEIYGQLLNKEGEQISEKLTLVSMDWFQSDPVLAYSAASGKYLLVFVDSNDIKGRIIGANGSPEGDILNIALDQNRVNEGQFGPDVVADNTSGRILVVWEDERGIDWLSDIYGRFLSDNGETIQLGSEFIVQEESDGIYLSEPSVAINTTDGTYLVAWRGAQSKLFAKKLTAEGTEMGDPVPIDPEGEELRNVKIVYNAVENNYLAVYEDQNNYPYRIKYKILQP